MRSRLKFKRTQISIFLSPINERVVGASFHYFTRLLINEKNSDCSLATVTGTATNPKTFLSGKLERIWKRENYRRKDAVTNIFRLNNKFKKKKEKKEIGELNELGYNLTKPWISLFVPVSYF